MTQSVGTPSHFYHRSLFSSRHRVVNQREMKEAFCYPLNCVIFGFVTHVLSDYATEEPDGVFPPRARLLPGQ